MDFSDSKPIYRQIVEYCYGNVMRGDWRAGERIPSVRELAVQLAVNSHTVLKAYEHLQAQQIIAMRRGIGFFLAADARERVNGARREEFFTETLPGIFAEMDLLGVDIDEVRRLYDERRK